MKARFTLTLIALFTALTVHATPPDNRPPDNRPPTCPGASCGHDRPPVPAPGGGDSAAASSAAAAASATGVGTATIGDVGGGTSTIGNISPVANGGAVSIAPGAIQGGNPTANGGVATANGGRVDSSIASTVSGSNTGMFHNDVRTGSVSGTTDVRTTANGGHGGAGGTGGTSGAASTSGSSLTGSGNGGGARVDASDRSSHSSTTKYNMVILPPVMPPMPPSVSQAGDVKVEVMSCGTMQTITRERVDGVFVGIVANDNIYLGTDDRLAPLVVDGKTVRYEEVPQLDGSVRVYGHQPVITTAPLIVSGARQFGFGGFGMSGGAQIGAGVSGAMGRLITTIQLRDCELPGYKQEKVAVEEAPLRTYERKPWKCYAVDAEHPLDKKPADLPKCPGGVRQGEQIVPLVPQDITVIDKVTRNGKTLTEGRAKALARAKEAEEKK